MTEGAVVQTHQCYRYTDMRIAAWARELPSARKHGSALVRNPAGELVQHTRANDRLSQPDIPLQTPPSSVAPRGVAVPADVRWSTQIPAEGSTAPQSPSSVKETHLHAQQTLDREQQQQHASTNRRDAAQAPAQLQQYQHVVTDAGSA